MLIKNEKQAGAIQGQSLGKLTASFLLSPSETGAGRWVEAMRRVGLSLGCCLWVSHDALRFQREKEKRYRLHLEPASKPGLVGGGR